MSANEDFFQGRKPAAVLKHALLAEYLHVFTAMLGRRYPRLPVWLIDGYAGPGRYEEDSSGGAVDGSPLIALRVADAAARWHEPRDVRCAFIEQNTRFAQTLDENVAPFRTRGRTAPVLCGRVQDRLPEVWAQVGASPALTLLDPFGVSLSFELMCSTVLSRQAPPSEVLLNINVEAVSRIGGQLARTGGGSVDVRPDLSPAAVERVDAFLGGQWWRAVFLDERERTGSAAFAAQEVVAQYRGLVCREANANSIAVPIRRRPSEQPLFLLTLFHRSEVAEYKFADAAARATRKWREAYRLQDLEGRLAKNPLRATQLDLFGLGPREVSADDAAYAEKQLQAELVDVVAGNIRSLVTTTPRLFVARQVSEILGSALSLGGEPVIRAAWKRLAQEGLVAAPAPGGLHKQVIVRL